MNTNIQKSLFFFLFCFISLSFFGQSSDFINGKVFDAKTKEPLPFATVLLANNNLGLAANEEGDFRISIRPNFLSDTISISFIGYNRQLIAFSKFKINDVNNIYLQPAIFTLGEVKLTTLKDKIRSKKVIKEVIKNISKNYPTDPFTYVSYYRDYQKHKNEYINLNEGIVHTFDNGFDANSNLNKYRLLDYKVNTDFLREDLPILYDTLNPVNYSDSKKFITDAFIPDQGGNELFILRVHDAIRNYNTNSFSYIYKLTRDLLKNHKFSNNKLKTAPWINILGELYVEPNNFAIHKIIYKCINKQDDNEIFNIAMEYGREQSIDSLMYLKYISFNNSFNIVDKTDKSYFRILDYKLHPTYLQFRMSNIVDEESVNNKDFYTFYSVMGKKLEVEDIIVKDKTIIVNFKSKNYKIARATAKISNFKDINGNLLGRKRILKYQQYRELFVLDINDSLKFKDSCFLIDKPLIDNCISKYNGENKYWMNTPEVIKKE
ncbi:carboxypeptidase-like regulatory domain-containing protein [Aureibaculum luteum]|uniref:carboxypeptidase-like regulatory domain-containing protein n=1 Tax=Aureibaculum luteum TaxID=1548456 RepID=UPI000E4AF3A9|nr:carboxypeptidase-like regulatory domain-containing protein [Aureibaculum luteum]